MTTQNDIRPVFVVGFSRSGTTYLQSVLAKNKNILCLPETQFFTELFGHINSHNQKLGKIRSLKNQFNTHILSHLGLSIDQWAQRYNKLIARKKLPHTDTNILSLRKRVRIDAFHSYLSNQCIKRGRVTYSEKSPSHLFYINEIEKSLPSSRFIHIVRDPEATLSSVIDAINKNTSWRARFKSPNEICKTWIKGARITQSYINSCNHLVVTHKSLKENQEDVLKNIEHFLAIPSEHWSSAEFERERNELIYDYENWKSDVKSGSAFSEKDKSHALGQFKDKQLLDEARRVYKEIEDSLITS